jgi:hypothetical protein
MKKLLLPSILVILSTACVRIKIASVDPITHATNTFSGTFFAAKGTAEKIDILRNTKTTSAMLSAKNTEVSGDAETIKAVFDGVNGLAEKAAAGAVKAMVKP